MPVLRGGRSNARLSQSSTEKQPCLLQPRYPSISSNMHSCGQSSNWLTIYQDKLYLSLFIRFRTKFPLRQIPRQEGLGPYILPLAAMRCSFAITAYEQCDLCSLHKHCGPGHARSGPLSLHSWPSTCSRYQRKAEIFFFLISLLAVGLLSDGRLIFSLHHLFCSTRKPYTTSDCSATPQQTFTNMHKSVFSYNLSRPYPYTWFTWVVVIGGILATAIFSFVNLVADGYELM
jgi:hypothetical protein